MGSRATHQINGLLRKLFGIQINQNKLTFEETRTLIISKLGIEFVIDGGSNSGQWATTLLEGGYQFDIFSFEPGSKAFQELKANSDRFPRWSCFNLALGNCTEERILNLADNSGASSSLYVPTQHLHHYPTVNFDSSEVVRVVRLDDVISNMSEAKFLKLDVQGFELEALKGASSLMPSVLAVELELSLIEMYQSEAHIWEVLKFMQENGFSLYTLSDFARNAYGQVTYLDAIWVSDKSRLL